MCGICGFIGTDLQEWDRKRVLQGMTNTLIHRGPDEEGSYLDEDASLGIRRLKVIDLETGSQPVYNEDKTLVTVFNGEIYNYRELREELIELGHSFSSRGDTEVIVHAYESFGDDFVQRLNGMFAIALWDKKQQTLILIRDRMGIKPLYYSLKKDGLIFASEIKAILKYPNFVAEIDDEMVATFLTLRYIPAPNSIYKQVKKMMPGSMLIWKREQLKERSYWRVSFDPEMSLGFEEATENFKELFARAVKRRMVSDVPLGIFLSGGIDSSLVASEMRHLSSSVNTFNVKFGPGYFDETQYALTTAEFLGTSHTVLDLGMDLQKVLRRASYFLDEPFADPAALPIFGMSERVREQVTVVLTGDGADEIFGGYDRYISELWAERVALLPGFVKNNIVKQILNLLRLSGLVRNRMRHLLERALLKMERLELTSEQRYIQHFYTFDWEEQKRLWNIGILPVHDRVRERFTQLIQEGRANFLNKRFYLDIHTWLPDQMLVKIDRMTMAHGLEARVPFLDHELVEFACRLPSEYKTSLLVLKRLLRYAAKTTLPHEIARRRKHGFAVPLDDLFRKDWEQTFNEVVSSKAVEADGRFNYLEIKNLLKMHQHGKWNYGEKLYSILMWFLWKDKRGNMMEKNW